MTDLLQIQDMLRDTQAAMAHLRQAIADDPSSPSLDLVRLSLEKRLAELEENFLETAKGLGIDVCSYRLFSETAWFRIV